MRGWMNKHLFFYWHYYLFRLKKKKMMIFFFGQVLVFTRTVSMCDVINQKFDIINITILKKTEALNIPL